MSFFQELQGLTGEQLSSAILRYILDRSPDLRRSFLLLLSERTVVGAITSTGRFSSQTETSTSNASESGGRVDILIETDNAVIGIENKLNAGFTVNQPGKYLSTIQDLAAGYLKLLQKPFQPLLVVLAPQARQTEIAALICDPAHVDPSDRDRVVQISWEDMLAAMASAEPADLVATFLLEQLRQFVFEATGSLKHLASIYATLRTRSTKENNREQTQFIRWLWPFFVNPSAVPQGIRLVNKVGRYIGVQSLLYPVPQPSQSEIAQPTQLAWYGFYSSTRVDGFREQKESSLLMLMTNFDVPFGTDFRRVSGRADWSPPYEYFWIIDFQSDWTEPENWIERLKPFQYEISKRVASNPES